MDTTWINNQPGLKPQPLMNTGVMFAETFVSIQILKEENELV